MWEFLSRERCSLTRVELPLGFTKLAHVFTDKQYNHACFKRIRNKILRTKHSLNGEKMIFTFKSLQYLFIMNEIFLPHAFAHQ